MVSMRGLTERIRNVLSLAQAAATQLGHTGVGAGHIALGLVCEGEGVARVLARHGFRYEDARARIDWILTSDPNDPPPYPPPAAV
jgi:ATP-dependent Clp protease ATP-binding subunit ClpA